MDVKIEGDGNTIAGRDINVVLTPDAAMALAKGLLKMHGLRVLIEKAHRASQKMDDLEMEITRRKLG
jgi:hypothetical protein